MSGLETFPIDEARLSQLKGTRGGRIALNGFEYQRAFAVLRLAAMVLGRAVSPVEGHVPVRLRYEWAEDIDEIDRDGRIVLWQCKVGDHWATAGKLAELLLASAPKWLWIAPHKRALLQLRLVTPDLAYKVHAIRSGELPRSARDAARVHFLRTVLTPPTEGSDRAHWQAAAMTHGPEALFDELWSATAVLYMPNEAVDAAADRRYAEQEAMKELAAGGLGLDPAPGVLDGVLQALRALLSVMPVSDRGPDGTINWCQQEPQQLLTHHVSDRLFPFTARAIGLECGLDLVDRTRLRKLRQDQFRPWFVARRADWGDVVAGGEDFNGFFERSDTPGLVARLGQALALSLRREGQLRVQWLVGAPGTGKSTLALRVATLLALDGACVVLDGRFMQDQETSACNRIVDSVRAVTGDHRPVLLLLDDPLGANSGWPRILKELGKRPLALVVLAATPDLLLENSEHLLENIDELPRHGVARPDDRERLALAEIYPGHRDWLMKTEEDLLILAMVAQAGKPFDSIVKGIWKTLNDGRKPPARATFKDLSWEIAAFTLVAYFHRAYAVCPLLLLEAFLPLATESGHAAGERLSHLVSAQGWHIFQMHELDHKLGRAWAGVASMHARVADMAWRHRPVKTGEMERLIATASVEAAGSARLLGIALATLRLYAAQDPDGRMPAFDGLMVAIATAWAEAPEGKLETRNLFSLVMQCHQGGIKVPASLRQALSKRAAALDAQSWLAQLALWIMDGDQAAEGGRDRLARVIAQADFSIAAGRAISFVGRLVRNDQALLAGGVERLWHSLDEGLDRSAQSALITWLLKYADEASTRRRLQILRAWLSRHPDEHTVRTALISWMSKTGAPDLQEELARFLRHLRSGPAFFTPASAALTAIGKLDHPDPLLMIPWMAWASDTLEHSRGQSERLVWNSVGRLLERARRQEGGSAVNADAAQSPRAAFVDARRRLERVAEEWRRRHGEADDSSSGRWRRPSGPRRRGHR